MGVRGDTLKQTAVVSTAFLYYHGKIVKSLLHSVFFTDQLKHKQLNKAISKTPSENPHQICPH